MPKLCIHPLAHLWSIPMVARKHKQYWDFILDSSISFLQYYWDIIVTYHFMFQVYIMMIWYMYKLWKDFFHLVNAAIAYLSFLFGSLVVLFVKNIYVLFSENFSYTVHCYQLLSTMFYIRSSVFIHFIAKNVYPFTSLLSIHPTPQPLAITLLLSVSVNLAFLGSTSRWFHAVFSLSSLSQLA